MKPYIYADNAATTRLSPAALEAMLPFLKEEYGNASQPYAFSRPVKKALKKAREQIASCIHAEPSEIYFTSGGTESDNWVIKGFTAGNAEQKAIITSAIEHHAVLNACQAVERLGYPVAYLLPDKSGVISPGALHNIITDRTGLVSVMFSNNEIGTVQPIRELAALAQCNGALFHTDAVQAVGHTRIDVKELGVDMLSASAHKFNGPKGIGFLYVRHGVSLPSLLDGGAQESGHRAGTENVASIVGMATALAENCAQLEETGRYLLTLEERLTAALRGSGIDFIRNGAQEHMPGCVSLSLKNAEGEAILHRLDLMGICISTGSACDSVNTQVSHVLQAIEVPDEYAKGTVRISLGKANTKEEVDEIASALIKILK